MTSLPVNSPDYWDATYQRELSEGRTRRHEHVWRALLNHIPSKGLVADIGCGTGEFLRWLRSQRPAQRLLGVDHSPFAISEAEGQERVATAETPGRMQIDFTVGDALDLRLRPGSVSCAYAGHLLEHLVSPVAALREMRRSLRRGGLMIVHFPHQDEPYVEHVQSDLTTGKVMGWLEDAGFMLAGHSDVFPGQPTNDAYVWGRK